VHLKGQILLMVGVSGVLILADGFGIQNPGHTGTGLSFTPDETELEVTIINHTLAYIRNVGNVDAHNVTCMMGFRGIIVWGPPDGIYVSDVIRVNESVAAHYKHEGFMLGVGPLLLMVTAWADNAPEVREWKVVGFLIGYLVVFLDNMMLWQHL